jgi:hypothetical protein
MGSALLNLLKAMWTSAKLLLGVAALIFVVNIFSSPMEQLVAAATAQWLYFLIVFWVLTLVWWIVFQLNPGPRS